ncbi:MAG: hypothetical protein SPG76_04705 [Candidatus Enterosoma sp.]|nr:hypothetical protein [bacterium]MDY4188557.1 hypothetical protein [Candidatus Enterosoma sp.]MDY5322990.1 hypothetical protein [Candidatus Enterosoma sp.]MDY5970614.1 hypothetical protein [Candidatus Enterosoma sp.]
MKQTNSESLSIKKKFQLFSLSVHKNLDRLIPILFILLATVIAFVARYFAAKFPTNDVVGFILNGWMKQIENVGFKNFYKVDADYSPLYLFIIACLTKLPKGELVNINGYSFYLNQMYYLKSIYFLCELLIAIGIYLIIHDVTKNRLLGVIGYCVFLFLPVQFSNSALWGNSDTMYFLCFVYILLFVLKGKSFFAWFFFGLALSLKLQAVFIAPFLFYLMFNRKLKFYPIYASLLALFLSFVPAYLCGASFSEPFHFFKAQVNGYSKLTLGCANLWQLFGVYNMDKADSPLNAASIIIGLGAIFVLTAILYLRKVKLTKENIITVSVFLIGICPFFLPHMHERYFYAVDVLVLVYALINKRRYFLIPLMQVSSGIAYYHYLTGFKKYFIDILGEDSVSFAAWINLFVLMVIFYDIMKLDHVDYHDSIDEIEEEKRKIKEGEEDISSTLTNGL